LGRLPHQAPPINLPQSQQTHPCQCISPTTLNCCPFQAPLRFPPNKPTSMPVFFISLQTKLRMSLQGCIVYLLLTYSADTHKARSSDLVYLVTWNPFTLLLGCKWTYAAMVHGLSHQAMTQASDQLHTTHFCSLPVLGNTCNKCNTCNVQSLLLLVHMWTIIKKHICH
jgi:hypothetical protein